MNERPKLWTLSFTSIFLTNLFTSHGFYILLASMPLFVADELHLTNAHVGIAMGIFSVSSVMVRPVAGVFLDSAGRMKLFVLSIVIFALCSCGYVFVGSFVAVLSLRLLHGVGWGMLTTAGATIAADVVPPARRAEGLGYYSMTMSIGMALGPALGVFLIDKINFSGVFLVCVGFAIASVVMACFVRVPEFQKKKAVFTLSGLFEKRVLGLAFMFLTFGITYGSIMVFAIIYGKGMGIANAGLFFMIVAVITAVMRPIVGKHLDKNGPGNTMGVGFVLLMVGMLAMSFANGAPMYFAAAVSLGFGVGIVMPLLAAMAMNVVPPNRRGAANATAFGAFDGGIGLGAVTLGKIAGVFSISTMYMFSFFILIIPLVFYYVYEKRNYGRLAAEMRKI